MNDADPADFLSRVGRGEPGSVLGDILNADEQCRR
jgi:hypothetical protein